ncbi:MAG: sulfotransferase domain-containing protein [Anaerolineales bacterium]|nr:sulfotransferase domain-containing protein [Anaerolineales bacterium]
MSARRLYDRLPASTRTKIRSLLPDQFLRWYAHKNTDVYLISYPKCGRTWLRLMVGRAIAQHYGLPETEDVLFIRWKKRVHPAVPHITVVHDDRPMLKTPEELGRTKKKYQQKKVIFLVRDPRDVIVSSYFEMSKRGLIFGENLYEARQPVFSGSVSEFINQRVGGFDTLLEYYNIWAENRSLPRDFLLVRYEDMKTDPGKELHRVLVFLGLGQITPTEIDEAVAFASFDRMRKMEAEGRLITGQPSSDGGALSSGILKPGDRSDQESYKTRRGETHGYVRYLDAQEIDQLNQKMSQKLSPFFGYIPE